MPFGPRLGIERCGKIKVVNSGAESCTGIGVVTGFAPGTLITHEPLAKDIAMHWQITLLHILQEVRSMCKTRDYLIA